MAGLAQGSGFVLVNDIPAMARALVRIEQLMLGATPTFARKSASADRAIFAPGPGSSRYIINVAAERMFDELDFHTTARTFDVYGSEARIAAAKQIAQICDEEGLETRIVGDAEPEFPEDFLIFVVINESQHIILLGPTDQDIAEMPAEMKAKLPPPSPWSIEVFNRTSDDF